MSIVTKLSKCMISRVKLVERTITQVQALCGMIKQCAVKVSAYVHDRLGLSQCINEHQS